MGKMCSSETIETLGKARSGVGQSLLSKGGEAGQKILGKVEDKLTESVDKIIDNKLGGKFDETLDKAVDILIDKSLAKATEIFDDGKKRLLNCALSKKAIEKMSEYNLLDPSIWNECDTKQLTEIGLNKKDIKKWQTAKIKYNAEQEAKQKAKEDEGIKRLKAVNIKEDAGIVRFLKENKWLNPEKWSEISEIDLVTSDINKTEMNGWKLAKDTMQKEKSREFGKTILKQWNIPNNLIKRIDEDGWIDPAYWRYLDRSQLKSMGFRDGHIQIFYCEFNKMKQRQSENYFNRKLRMKQEQIEEEQYEQKYDSESDSDKKEEKELLHHGSSHSVEKGVKKNKRKVRKFNGKLYQAMEFSADINKQIDYGTFHDSQTSELRVINDDMINNQKVNEGIMDWKDLLSQWGIPYSLIGNLEEEGWINPLLWDNLADDDMEEIGFKQGHIALFRKQYTEFKRGKSLPQNQNVSWKNLLASWDLPQRLIKNMEIKGWTDPMYWNNINISELQSLEFETGHIITFNKKLRQYNKSNNDKKVLKALDISDDDINRIIEQPNFIDSENWMNKVIRDEIDSQVDHYIVKQYNSLKAKIKERKKNKPPQTLGRIFRMSEAKKLMKRNISVRNDCIETTITVSIKAERKYGSFEQLSASSQQQNREKASSSDSAYKKSLNSANYSTSGTSASSNETETNKDRSFNFDVSANIPSAPVGISAKGGQTRTDNLKSKNTSSKSFNNQSDTNKQNENKSSTSRDNETELNDASSSNEVSKHEWKSIEAGFTEILPKQTIPFPINITSPNHVVYMTIKIPCRNKTLCENVQIDCNYIRIASKGSNDVVYCPDGESLQKFKTNRKGFQCIDCQKIMTVNAEIWKCNVCEYILCKDCHEQFEEIRFEEKKFIPDLEQNKYDVEEFGKSQFDENGLLYFLGTNYGKQTYSNPVDICLVEAMCSSNRTNLKEDHEFAFVGRDPAGWYTYAEEGTWIAVNLKDIQLKLTHYALRHSNFRDGFALRTWNLEGSNDGETWEILKKHNNDESLKKKSQIHLWNVDTNKYYKYFRINLTGTDSWGRFAISCAGMEFYGVAYGPFNTKKDDDGDDDDKKKQIYDDNDKDDDLNLMQDLLNSWKIPQDCMTNMMQDGWINPKYWDKITPEFFTKMGFKPGHIVIFKEKWSEWKNERQQREIKQSKDTAIYWEPTKEIKKVNKQDNINYQTETDFKIYETADIDSDDEELMDMVAYIDIDRDELLGKWHLEQFSDRFADEGWNNPLDWIYLNDETLRNNIGMRAGHIQIFNRKYSVWLQRYNEARQIIHNKQLTDGIFIVKEGETHELKSNHPYVYKKIVLQKNATLTVQDWTASNRSGGVLLLNCIGSIFMSKGSMITAKGFWGGDKIHKNGYGPGGGIYNTLPCGGSYASAGKGVFPFDEGGLLYYLGTNGGKEKYSNPALPDKEGKIEASYSSIDKKIKKENQFAFVGREGQQWKTLDPKEKDSERKEDSEESWIAMNLKNIKIRLSHYALRHSTRTDRKALRTWNLEGSNDGKNWELVKEHKNDESLKSMGMICLWKVDTREYYSNFRVIMKGKNSGDTWNLSCSGWEIYGEAHGIDNKKTKIFTPSFKTKTYGDEEFNENKFGEHYLGSGNAYLDGGGRGHGGGAIKIECKELIMDKGSSIDVSGGKVVNSEEYRVGGSGGGIWITVHQNVKYKNDGKPQITALGAYDNLLDNKTFPGGNGRVRVDYKDKDCQLFTKYTTPTPYFGYGKNC